MAHRAADGICRWFSSQPADAVCRQAAIFSSLAEASAAAASSSVNGLCRSDSVAQRLGALVNGVAAGSYRLHKRRSGKGQSGQRAGEATPLCSRLALLAQGTDVFRRSGGPASAMQAIR